MTDISSGFIDPGDDKNADRKDLPMTQVDEEEVDAQRGEAVDAPSGQGAGIGGEPTRLPAGGEPRDARDESSTPAAEGADGTEKPDGLGSDGTIPNVPGGVGVGAGAPTTFEPEEDIEAARRRDDRSAI